MIPKRRQGNWGPAIGAARKIRAADDDMNAAVRSERSSLPSSWSYSTMDKLAEAHETKGKAEWSKEQAKGRIDPQIFNPLPGTRYQADSKIENRIADAVERKDKRMARRKKMSGY